MKACCYLLWQCFQTMSPSSMTILSGVTDWTTPCIHVSFHSIYRWRHYLSRYLLSQCFDDTICISMMMLLCSTDCTISPCHHITPCFPAQGHHVEKVHKYKHKNTITKNAQISKHTHTNTEQQHTVFPISYPPHRKNTQIEKQVLHHLIPSVNRSSRPPRGKSTRPATHSQSDNQTT